MCVLSVYVKRLWNLSNTNQLVFASLSSPIHSSSPLDKMVLSQNTNLVYCPLLKTLQGHPFISGEKWDPSQDCCCPVCSGLPPSPTQLTIGSSCFPSPHHPASQSLIIHWASSCSRGFCTGCSLLLKCSSLSSSPGWLPLSSLSSSSICSPEKSSPHLNHIHMSLAHIFCTFLYVRLCYELCLSRT